MKQFFITYLFLLTFISSCSSQNNNKKVPHLKEEQTDALDMNLSKEMDAKFVTDSDTLIAIIFNEDSIFCYWENNLKKGVVYSISNKNSFRSYISNANKNIGDKFLIILKPTPNSSYKSTVDVLDEMTITQIKKYSMSEVSKEEAFFLAIPMEIKKTIKVETKTPAYSKPYLLLIIKGSGEIYYVYSDSIYTSDEIKISPLTTDKIFEELNNIEKKYTLNLLNITVLIKGDEKSKYNDFEKLVNAVKRKKIYKYHLVTNSDEIPK